MEGEAVAVMGEALRKRATRHWTQLWSELVHRRKHRWCYLYRAIDRDGNLIDTMLSRTRDMKAARRFFPSARSAAGFVPNRVTADGHNSYPRAIRSTLGRNVRHRTSGACVQRPPRLIWRAANRGVGGTEEVGNTREGRAFYVCRRGAQASSSGFRSWIRAGERKTS